MTGAAACPVPAGAGDDQGDPHHPFTAAGFAARARARLHLDRDPLAAEVVAGTGGGSPRFDQPPRPWAFEGGAPPRAAAVLIGVMAHEGGATLLMTLRAAHLRDHSSQIAFPGGKIDAGDASPLAAALREAREEVGLEAARVTPLGYLDPYLTGTGFLVVPTVALVTPPVALTPNPDEVEDVFEVPLAFLMDQANHARCSREFNGQLRHFYVMAYGRRRIWGATAGMIRTLFERLYG